MSPGEGPWNEIVWDDPPARLTALRRARPNGPAAPQFASARRNPRQHSLPVVTGAGSHPFPFRTRKLSLLPPMVLRGKLRGRVGRCRHYPEGPTSPYKATPSLFFVSGPSFRTSKQS